MAKRETYEVDEESLRELMAGDAPMVRRETPKGVPVVQPAETKEESPPEPSQKPEARPAKRKKLESDYRSLFLVNVPSSYRCQTYINRDVYDSIKRFLPTIAPDVSITGYINNVLVAHLEQYKDEINELYKENSQKPAL